METFKKHPRQVAYRLKIPEEYEAEYRMILYTKKMNKVGWFVLFVIVLYLIMLP